jgi:hypothetical protein
MLRQLDAEVDVEALHRWHAEAYHLVLASQANPASTSLIYFNITT